MSRMKVLLAYDGSDCGNTALRELDKAGLPPSTEVRVVSVADVYLPGPTDEGLPSFPEVTAARELARGAVQAASDRARTAAEQVRAKHPGWTVSHEATADSPAWGIIKLADAWEPDLIVLGSHGHSAIRRLTLGSVSAKVLAHAGCSVRVARDGFPDRRTTPIDASRRLLIGLDGSVGSATALSAVSQRSWPAGTEVLVLSVLDLRTVTSILAGGPGDARKQAQHAADNACDELRAVGLTATAKVIEGDVRDELALQAEQWKADCIFVGAKGTSMVRRFLLGSVSSSIAGRAGCSVEVIRQPA